MSRRSDASDTVQRLHRQWHAVLGSLSRDGWIPRRLTDEERRRVQSRLFGCASIWDIAEDRAAKVADRLRQADPSRLAAFVWVWAMTPDDEDEQDTDQRFYDTLERIGIVVDGLDIVQTKIEQRRILAESDPLRK